MALTAEQQAQVDIQIAVATDNYQRQAVLEAKRAKLDLVRTAKETLVENARNRNVGEREISAEDITSFATTLENYVNS